MNIFLSFFLPLSLVFIMFSLGLALRSEDFTRVLRQPLAFAVGLFCQVILLPIITFGLVLAFGISGEFAIGFMILSACPGGVTSNAISRYAHGDVALSVSLTAVANLICVLTIPLILGFSFQYFLGTEAGQISIFKTALMTFLLTVVPTLIGLLVRAKFPTSMGKAEPTIARIAAILFLVVVAAILAISWSVLIENFQKLGMALFALATVLTVLGLLVSKVAGLEVREAKTIAIETGLQNSTLGITLAALLVGGTAGFNAFSLPAAVYGVIMLVLMMVFVPLARRFE
ncbi:MAG: bile acid:sodium symporter family protein [Roseibium sp.]